MTKFQPARSMIQNFMEEPNLSLGSVNAECLQNWTVRGRTQESHSVLELCLPSSEMQRVRQAHTRRIASPLCPTDSERPRQSWWEMLSSETHSFLQSVSAKSGSLCDSEKKNAPLFNLPFRRVNSLGTQNLSGKAGRERERQPGPSSLPCL